MRSAPAKGTSHENSTCLLIDDDVEEHFIFSMAVEETGKNLQCEYFTDCEQAVSFLAVSNPYMPAYIFLDRHLGQMAVEDCLQNLSNLAVYTSTKVILYTSHISEDDYQSLSLAGISGLLQKSPSIGELSSRINSLLAVDGL